MKHFLLALIICFFFLLEQSRWSICFFFLFIQMSLIRGIGQNHIHEALEASTLSDFILRMAH